MGLGDFLQDSLDGASNIVNTMDRYTNPFHVEVSWKDGKKIVAKDDDERHGLLAPAAVQATAGVEEVATALNWFYSNALSQPLSTFFLMAARADKTRLLSAADWGQAWHAAEHISPGQSLALKFAGGWNLDPLAADRAARRAIESPLQYYEPQAADLPSGWKDIPEDEQQRILHKAGMPAVGNRYIESLRERSDLLKYGSGTADFAFRMFADPTILGLKAVGAARNAAVTMRRPASGWSPSEIDAIMEKSVVTKAKHYIMANRDNPQLLNNLDMAKKSAMGPRFGHVASLLKSESEVADFLRVGMGDVAAMERLEAANSLAAARMTADFDRLATLGLQHTTYINAGHAGYAAAAEQSISRVQARINADTDLVSRYEAVLAHADELDQLNLSRWGFTRAEQRTAAQNEYQAGAARRGRTRYRPLRLPEPLAARRAATQDTAAADAHQAALSAGASRAEAGSAALVARTAAVPFGSGLVKTRIWGLGDFYSTPVTMVRALREKSPNGWLRLDDVDDQAIAEVRGHLARIPNIRPETRQKLLNQYLKATTEAERRDLMYDIGRLGAARIAEKHGLGAEAGLDIYKEHLKRQFGEIDNLKRYSGAWKQGPAGTRIRVDEFAADGGRLVVEPFTATRLVNGHAFQSLDDMDRILARHSSALKAIRASRAGNPDWVIGAADYLSYLWKFGTLFRLGYIPRVLGDDLAGQVARLGAATMAARIGWGVRNGATNIAHRSLAPFAQAKEKVALEGARYADEELALLRPQMADLGGRVTAQRSMLGRDAARAQRRRDAAAAKLAAHTGPAGPKRAALEKLVASRDAELAEAQRAASTGLGGENIKHLDLERQVQFLEDFKALQVRSAEDAKAYRTKRMQGQRPVRIGDTEYPAAFAGPRGEYFMKSISADDSVSQIFETNKQLIHGALQRSFDSGGRVVSVAQDEGLHLQGWSHALNNQMGQDALSRMALKGASADEMRLWLTRTPQGRTYRKRLPKMMSAEDAANAAWHEAAEYAPDPLIRAAALRGEATAAFLKTAVPNPGLRPYEVHVGQVGGSQLAHANQVDRGIHFWFKWAATVPADRMSRHPLFNQLYEGHLRSIAGTRMKHLDESAAQAMHQGLTGLGMTPKNAASVARQMREPGDEALKRQLANRPMTVAEVDQVTEAARRLALRDTRRLVFDIAHRSDAAAALRFMSPFFSATSEAFQRWARIIADKPQTVGYAANWFNVPMATGSMQDMDGNTITPSGHVYTIDPKTGKAVKRLVPKAERWIVARMPKWLVDSPLGVAFGVERASGNMALSQNSLNIVTQGDPWFNPGVGPVVSIPVNELVKDKPAPAELARHLGILPFGPQGGSGILGENFFGRAVTMAFPATVKNFLTAFDTSDDRYQRVKLHILQKAVYEHESMGKKMPSRQEIARMTRDYWLFTAASAFLQPAATQRKDNFQFYRDQYSSLRRRDPLSADQEFLERFGESYFIFAQAETSNASGIQATRKAVQLTERYRDLISESPELGALIVGPEGNGPFSREAYAYQLNTPLIPGDSEMQRTRMSAEEAMKENQRRAGWAKFTSAMNRVTAELHDAGFGSFADPGAEEYAKRKRGYIAALSQPTYPDGSPNPNYNAEWADSFGTFRPGKYDRLIPALRAVAESPLADEPHRSDLRLLQEYLGGRQHLLGELRARDRSGGSKTLRARSNADLRARWIGFVDSLRERDTRFGDLHSRYLSRDLGVDAEDEGGEE